MTTALNWNRIFPDGNDIEAETDIGTYTISFDSPGAGSGVNLWLAGDDDDTFELFTSTSEAQQVAQQHFNSKETIPFEIIDRYWNMLSDIEPKQEDEPGTSIPHIKWMISELKKKKEIGKHNRWLGFIQYGLIINGYTTTTEERNFTRPFFSKK